MTTVDGGAALCKYGPDGQRIRKQVGSERTEYLEWQGEVLAERNTAGEWSEYVRWPDNLARAA